MSVFGVRAHAIFLVDNPMVRRNECCENEMMLLGNVVTRRVSEETASKSPRLGSLDHLVGWAPAHGCKGV